MGKLFLFLEGENLLYLETEDGCGRRKGRRNSAYTGRI
jgi:hypothetical protein